MSPDNVQGTLLGLPAEILQQIAADVRQVHSPSFYSFASVNKACHAAAIPLLYLSIFIDAQGLSIKALDRRVADCLATLDHYHAHGYVRRLTLYGDMKLPPEYYVAGAHEIDKNALSNADTEVWYPACDGENAYGLYRGYAIRHPALELLKALPNLTDLVIDSEGIPACLLEFLHQGLPVPRCKLTISRMSFRSPHRSGDAAHHMAIATSPALHSVRDCNAKYGRRDRKDVLLAFPMIAGGAPNLKEVTFYGSIGEWLPEPTAPKRGSLTSLTLHCPQENDLQVWADHTDFIHLRSLAIVNFNLIEDDLRWLAQDIRLPNLRSLNVSVEVVITRDEDEEWYDEQVDAAVASSTRLPRLKVLTLCINSHATEIISRVLTHHGSTLKNLNLHTVSGGLQRPSFPSDGFGVDVFREIRDRCPLLEHLRTDVRRTFSDAQEVAIYRTLGGISTLRSLALWLKCCHVCRRQGPYRATGVEDIPASWDAYDRQAWPFNRFEGSWSPRNGHIREFLANCAFDEPLARSIWDVICGGGGGDSDASSRPASKLQRLSLHTEDDEGLTVGGLIVDGKHHSPEVRQLYAMFYEMKRSYLLQRSVRYGDDTVFAAEIARQRREKRAKKAEMGGDIPVEREEEPARDTPLYLFRRIWPEKKGPGGWRNDWFGLPLQRS
ncbi:hypothetical protein EDB81DRAFT_112216 [Dactylonectria macrodidyma]|uniref:Uncharacterized protein n=1 Tax=Dactylonectria macrodidyma TaxID=307937 RepID=A0A9P9IX65_9HYPO|nr:hypothetical protein EDB81DRAFT_112216 [Dactylonectria macrodidyma]